MNELIKIEKSNVGGDLIDTVNARELHSFLEVGEDFPTWIKNYIKYYGFVEGVDYLVHKSTEQLPNGWQCGEKQKIDYHISVDMAKELAMIGRSDKGREARQYFIDRERRLKRQTTPITLPLIENDLKAIVIVADILRVSEKDKLEMVRVYCEQHVPRIMSTIPTKEDQ